MTSQIKASIISRAEAESSDEDSEDEQQHTEAFLEDFDDVTLRRDIKVGGDGHDEEDGEGENAEGENGVNATPKPVAVVSSLFPNSAFAGPITNLHRLIHSRRHPPMIPLRTLLHQL